MFEKFQPAKADPILGLSKLFQADPRAEKIDLGVGVYKDDNGITPVMSSVKKAEARCCKNRIQKPMYRLPVPSFFVIRCAILFLATPLLQIGLPHCRLRVERVRSGRFSNR